MKKLIILILFLSACTQNYANKKKNIANIIFSQDLTLDEFKVKLEEYGNNSLFPNID